MTNGELHAEPAGESMSDLARLDRVLEQLEAQRDQLAARIASLRARIEQIETARDVVRAALGYEGGPRRQKKKAETGGAEAESPAEQPAGQEAAGGPAVMTTAG